MKRVVIAVCLLAVTVWGGFFATAALRRTCDGLAVTLEESRAAAGTGTADEADAAFRRALTEWDRAKSLFHVLINHNLMRDAEIDMRRAEDAAERGDRKALADRLEDCLENVRHIRESAEPSLSNIF